MVAGFARPAGLHFLPEDRATVDRALVAGRTLLETTARARSCAAIDRLAAERRAGTPLGAPPGGSGGEQQVEPARGEATIATSSGS